jgi:DNA-directed RNA polymerase subunit L
LDLKITKKTADEISIEFSGEGHTLLNLLRTELLADNRVMLATYDTKFPVMDNPVFRLKTAGEDPVAVLRDAATKIISQCDEFCSLFAAAVK